MPDAHTLVAAAFAIAFGALTVLTAGVLLRLRHWAEAARREERE